MNIEQPKHSQETMLPMHAPRQKHSRALTHLALLTTAAGAVFAAQPSPDLRTMERLWKSGETLPAEIAASFPIPPLQVPNDTGINVLVDLAHQCAFATMWGLPSKLNSLGFRSLVSHAAIDTVLTPGRPSRVRLSAGQASDGKPLRPFGWVPNPRFNVVITFQSNPNAQPYLAEERAAAAAFVEGGGGLVIIDSGLSRLERQRLEPWADLSLATSFGVDIKSFVAGKTSALPGPGWETVRLEGKPIADVYRRTQGKGRVVMVSSLSLIDTDKKTTKADAEAKKLLLKEIIAWAAGGSAPVGGEARFSQAQGGGGGIYPELEERLKGVVVYYARNQKEHLLKAVREELPRIAEKLYAWLPSPVPEEPMFIILAAGNGGGWAVNAYYPKETGTISLDPTSLLGIFGHELGHTLSGPHNAKGEVAGHWFDGNQGEAHAGFWQGKILALYSDNKSMRDCNELFKFDKNAAEIDLAQASRDTEKSDKRKVWKKLWWVWQKLDDRYGTTWYPRWRWVQHTRWQDDPKRRLTLDEMVEDMSIACGEDLLPFFKKIGTTLKRDRLASISFQGQTLALPVAALEVSPAGNARHEPIGDYTKPIHPK